MCVFVGRLKRRIWLLLAFIPSFITIDIWPERLRFEEMRGKRLVGVGAVR
jgi:hypothetical protein